MKLASVLLDLINAYKTNASVILTIVSGLGMILSKNYGDGFTEVFQGMAILFGGASVASLRHDLVAPAGEIAEHTGQIAVHADEIAAHTDEIATHMGEIEDRMEPEG